MTPFSEPFAPGTLAHDRYRIVGTIGSGGIATVYRAVDEQLGRTVALKVIPLGTSDLSERRRVDEEGRLLAGFSHPALVTLFDVVTDDGTRSSTLVMQYIEGEDLSARIARGPLPKPDVAEIGAAIAGALAFVHDSGVIHRDVKPANILLPASGGQPAMLADFGIARLVDSAGMTATGTVMGTASYLSPEQARGSSLSDRSDVYSLGLVLLEALTGVRAFPGSAVESVAARLGSDPSVPSDLGQNWVDLLVRMVDRDPAARPSAAEVQEALGMLGGPTATVPLPAALAATERLAPAASTERLAPLAATERLHPLPDSPLAVAAPAPRATSKAAGNRRGWVVIAALAAILLVAAVVFAATRTGTAPATAPIEPAESSPAQSVVETPEPLPPIVYPAVDGDLGVRLAALQNAVGAIDDDETARALGEQVLAVSEAAAAGDFETARTGLDELTRAIDAAELSAASRQSITEAADGVRKQLDSLIKDAGKPGNGKPDKKP